MRLSPSRDRMLAAGVACALLAGAAPSSATPQASEPVPELGRFIANSQLNKRFPGVVNALVTNGSVTVMYLSLGTTEPGFLGFGVPSDDKPSTIDASLRTARLIDPASGKVYRPIQSSAHPVCVCSDLNTLPSGFDREAQLITVAAVFPKLEPGTVRVDVDVDGEGTIVPDIPVSQGEAFAASNSTQQPVIMGQGWPFVDIAAATAVTDQKPFITDLISVIQSEKLATKQEATQTKTEIAVDAKVLFAFDKSALSPSAKEVLAAVAGQIKDRAVGTVSVVGHTDGIGPDAYNLDLSKRRATSVANELKRLIPGLTVTATGKGKSEPVASNSTETGRAQNRRVVITFTTKEG